jgi:hypothetical protein
MEPLREASKRLTLAALELKAGFQGFPTLPITDRAEGVIARFPEYPERSPFGLGLFAAAVMFDKAFESRAVGGDSDLEMTCKVSAQAL